MVIPDEYSGSQPVVVVASKPGPAGPQEVRGDLERRADPGAFIVGEAGGDLSSKSLLRVRLDGGGDMAMGTTICVAVGDCGEQQGLCCGAGGEPPAAKAGPATRLLAHVGVAQSSELRLPARLQDIRLPCDGARSGRPRCSRPLEERRARGGRPGEELLRNGSQRISDSAESSTWSKLPWRATQSCRLG